MTNEEILAFATTTIGSKGSTHLGELARSTFLPTTTRDDERLHEAYESLGLSVMTDMDEDTVISVSFYGRKLRRWDGEIYTGELPKQLTFGMLRPEVHALLGAPLQGRVDWDKWDYGDYTLRAEYNGKGEGGLRVVTLGLS